MLVSTVTANYVNGSKLFELYNVLFKYFGPQHWWPADTPFEVMVGAILTQNTIWRNAERAIANIKRARLMDARILRRHAKMIPRLIRPSGFYRQKSKYLVAFLDYFVDNYMGHVQVMKQKRTTTLRRELLSLKGIGPETADSILLYALSRPVFVIDAYTRRILSRHGWCTSNASYEVVRALIETSVPRRIKIYNEYHALFVRVGKEYCKKREPCCDRCPVHRTFIA